jgi:hypothetical protein
MLSSETKEYVKKSSENTLKIRYSNGWKEEEFMNVRVNIKRMRNYD